MRIRALKTYRCGEPPGGTTEPPKKIADLIVKLLGKHGRTTKGAEYITFPVELGKALVADGSAEEIDAAGNVVKAAAPKKEKK